MGMITNLVDKGSKAALSGAKQLRRGIQAATPYAQSAAGKLERGAASIGNSLATSPVARRAAVGGTIGAIGGAATGTGPNGESSTTFGQKVKRGLVGGVFGAGAGYGAGKAGQALLKTAFWDGFEKRAGSLSTSRVDRFIGKLEKGHDKSLINDVHRRVFANDTLKKQRLGQLKSRAGERASGVQARGGFKGTDI